MAKGHRSQVKREGNTQKDTRPSAILSYARVSVQKAYFVLDVTRGRGLQTVLGIVTYGPRHASSLIKKLLESAAANTKNSNGIDPAEPYVEERYANQGPTIERARPRAQGRAYRIGKGMNHTAAVLNERQEVNIGQKVNPHGLRVGIIKDWDSEWYTKADSADRLVEDYNIRELLRKRLFSAGVPKIEAECTSDRVRIIIYTTKPGVVIGKGGSEIEKPKEKAQKLTDKKLLINIKGIKRLDRDAQLVVESIAGQLENRVSFRRAMKSAVGRTMKAGVKDIKAAVAGHPGGADIAHTEFYSEGTIPLQMLRADIDYGFTEADTTYGKTGVKVWIYKGEVLPTKGNKEGNDK